MPVPSAEPALLVPQPGATGLQPRTVPERVAQLCVRCRAGTGRREAALRLRRDLEAGDKAKQAWAAKKARTAKALPCTLLLLLYILHCAWLNGGVKGKHVASRAERNLGRGPACPQASAP